MLSRLKRTNSQRLLFASLAIVFALILAACAPNPGAGVPDTGQNTVEPATGEPTGAPEATPSGEMEIGGYDDLVGALEAAGTTVEPAGEEDQPFFGNRAQVIKVNGEDVQAFEFNDQAAQEAAAQTIQANGYIIGTAAVDWVSQPYFWGKGRLIVLYVGTEESIIDQLTSLLGEPLTSPQSWPTQEGTPSGGRPGGAAELVSMLEAAGATVEPGGEIEEAFFGPVGQVFKVNGADVQVFEYPDEAAREAESGQISPDGSSIGTTMVTWVDDPHFWAQGRTIVLYVGSDEEVVDLLNQALGPEITK